MKVTTKTSFLFTEYVTELPLSLENIRTNHYKMISIVLACIALMVRVFAFLSSLRRQRNTAKKASSNPSRKMNENKEVSTKDYDLELIEQTFLICKSRLRVLAEKLEAVKD